MDVLIVVGLIVLAIVFILLELFLIPGFSISGIVGILLMGVAVWYAYANLGSVGGNLTLAGSFVLTGLAVWGFIKSKALEKMSLKTNVSGTVDTIDETVIKVGDKGKTISRLAPMGKVLINGEVMEAKTIDEFIDQDEEIVVLEVYKTNVLVEKA